MEEEPQAIWGRTTDLLQASQIASSHIKFLPLARLEPIAERGREISLVEKRELCIYNKMAILQLDEIIHDF